MIKNDIKPVETENDIRVRIIAEKLSVPYRNVLNTIELLDEGCTIPFISRYRKERTGSLDEVKITAISDMTEQLREIEKRKATILKSISTQGLMTTELKEKIESCWNENELEDIYLPFKPKRRTRAQIAREAGLEHLAIMIMAGRIDNPYEAAERFTGDIFKNADEAIHGAQDIIAEMVSEDSRSRQHTRNVFRRKAVITSKVVKSKAKTDEAAKFSDYFDWEESLGKCSSHRLLAMRRGESMGILRVSINVNEEECTSRLKRMFVRNSGKCRTIVENAIDDAYKRLIKPSIETEFASISKEKADSEAIAVFAENLRQLLLSPPLGHKRTMGIDPGYRTGCKVVCLDQTGSLIHFEPIYPHMPIGKWHQASERLKDMIIKYAIEAIAIGNGTASRETRKLADEVVASIDKEKAPRVFVVSEDGASVYSASAIAREEFPDEDVTVRGAVSIARRLIDPLAELVKIDAKSIGVGQYQHDVDQSRLRKSLDNTVVSCVNSVGVNINTASRHLLTYISGLGPVLAKNIVEYRNQNGPFTSRAQIRKVPRLGQAAFQQCAGFLRIPEADNPLDNSAVHPERYDLVEQMAKDYHCTVEELISNKDKRKEVDISRYVTDEVGLPTLRDIMAELEKPGRDPRETITMFDFDSRVNSIDDLSVGMILPGIVTNITNFGAFVDIGVHQDGLVHISQLADHYVSNPSDVVRLHQHVKVRVTEIDTRRNRISLTMKQQ